MTDSDNRTTISIEEIARLGGFNSSYYRAQMKKGLAPRPIRAGVPRAQALAWLRGRAERAAARAARTAESLRAAELGSLPKG